MELEYLIGQNDLEKVLLLLFVISFVIQLLFVFVFYFRLLFVKKPEVITRESSLTVILNVRNEEGRIEMALSQILKQNYGSFEVIVVDDFSQDRTLEILGTWSQKDPRLKFTTISQETRFSEKLSINLGLKASHSEWVVLIPASAEISDTEAFQSVNGCFSEEAIAVVGYSNFKQAKGFVLMIARLERFTEFLRSAAYSHAGLPLIFNENNVFFKKSVYFDNQGFKGKLSQYHANLELVLNDHLNRAKVCLLPICSVFENELPDKQSVVNLIRKNILLRQAVGFQKRLLLLLEDLSGIVFIVSFVLLLVFKWQAWYFFVILFLVPNIFNLFIVKKISDRLNEAKIFIPSFMYILIKPLINMYHAVLMYIQEHRSKWN